MNELPQSDVLAEACPESLDLLIDRFARDPLNSQTDLPALIAAYRAQAERFALAEAAQKRPPRPAKAKKEKLKSTAEAAADNLKAAIVVNALHSGEKLPWEG